MSLPRWRVPVVGTALAAAVLFCAGIVAAPALEARGHGGGRWLRLAYAPLCHQLSERSLALEGRPLAVCARCSGLYAGGLAGLLLSAAAGLGVRRPGPRARWLLAAVAPTALDVLAYWTGFGGLGNVPRALAALPGGFALGCFLGIGLNDLGRMMRRDRPHPKEPKRWTRASPTC